MFDPKYMSINERLYSDRECFQAWIETSPLLSEERRAELLAIYEQGGVATTLVEQHCTEEEKAEIATSGVFSDADLFE